MKFFVDKTGYLNKPDYCDNEKIVLPQNTKTICDFAFSGFQSLKEIQLPSSLKAIGEKAFFQCSNLEVINLPDSLNFIEANAFEECYSLQIIKLPINVDYIKEMTFLDCRALKKVVLSPNTTSISDFAFKNCFALKDINLPDSIERIGVFAFLNCHNLEEIKLPKQLKEISKYCFVSCSKIKRIDIPNKVTSIGEESFHGCLSLEEINLPKSIKVIEKNAFIDCKNINKITLYNPTNLTQMGLKNHLTNLEYAYKDKNTNQLIITKNKIEKQNNYEPINYKVTQKYLNSSKECAIIISSIFSLDKLKENKMKFVGPLLNNIFLEENYLEIINNISYNNKEFSSLYKRLNLNTYFTKNLLSEDNTEIYSLFKLAYNLGAFNSNQIERQKACEYLMNLFDKNLLSMYNIVSAISNLQIKEYNEEWASFIMDKNNTNEIFNKKRYQYLYRTYNEFKSIKEFSRSNKGNQHYNKITIDTCKTYFLDSKFEGVSSLTEDIASTFAKFTRRQSLFDEAKQIREEYIKLKEENKINDHILEEPLFEQIDNVREEIAKEKAQIIDFLSEKSSKNFTYEFLSKYDVANFVLGKYCDCCAHIEASGYSVMKASILHPDCQNLVIRNNQGQIIAKSTLYINKKERYGLFNNIEVAENISNKEKTLIYKKYIEAVNLFATKYNQKHPHSPLIQINVGTHLNDLITELEKHTKESEIILKGIDFSTFGNMSFTHEGDWKQGQKIIWENKKSTRK